MMSRPTVPARRPPRSDGRSGGDTTALVRLAQSRTVLAVVAGRVTDAEVAAAVRRILPAAPWDAIARVRRVAEGLHVVLIGPANDLPAEIPDLLAWGAAIGERGEATLAEAQRAADDPTPSSSMRGTWAVLQVRPGAVRFVTSASPPQTLRRVDGPRRVAWATQALVACRLADREVRLNSDAIAEFIVRDFVAGDEELVSGSTVLADATVLDIAATGTIERSWWPAADRVHPGEPTTPGQLRSLVGEVVRGVSTAPDALMGLTAGLDSSLVASCLAESGGVMPAFTLGDARFYDVKGARAMCDHLGWSHEVLSIEDPRDWPVDDLARGALWHAADVARNWLEGGIVGGDPHAIWVGGWGAEIGRARFWRGPAPPADPLDALAPGPLLRASRPATAAKLMERQAAELEVLAGLGRPQPDVLDLFYTRGKMRKWAGAYVPPTFRAQLGVFLEPEIVRALLDIPLGERWESRLLRQAHRAGAEDLFQIAARATTPTTGEALLERARRRLVQLGLRPVWDWPRLERGLDVADRAGGLEVVRASMGPQWLESTRGRAGELAGTSARRMLWNALTVAGLALAT